MAENVPPASKTATADAARGIPYYEKLRRDLRDTINKKRTLDRNLSNIEAEIYRLETAYLEDTSVAGNIIKGFDNYIKAATNTAASGTISGAALGGRGRKGVVTDADRVFSRSSVSFHKEGESGPASAVSTPGSGTPAASVVGEKKKKKAVTVDEDEGRSSKRQQVSFGSRKRGDD